MAADIASMTVRPTLLNGSCSVSDQPDVWQCVRSAIDFGFFGLKLFMIFAQSMRAARIFAISMNGFMPMPQKKERRGANASMSMPASTPVRTYSNPSARVYASSMSADAPASCMWYPEMEIELNFGIFCEVYANISPIMRIENAGG